MTEDQLREISHIVWAAKELGKSAEKVEKAMRTDVKADVVSRLKVETGQWFKPEEWEELQGDAGNANGDYFRLYFKKTVGGPVFQDGKVDIAIFCPTFLRGMLRITVRSDGGVGGSY